MNQSASGELGRATIHPDVAIAGAYGTWRLTFTAGAQGLAPGGSIRVYTDSDSDWGWPQALDPTAAEYMTVRAPEGVSFSLRIDNHKTLRLFLGAKGMPPGDSLEIVFGDASQGGPGSRAQTFIEDPRFFWVDVDLHGNGEQVTLPDPPSVRVVDDEMVRLVAIAPSTVREGQPFRVLIKAEDRWGNPSTSYQGEVALGGDGIDVDLPGQSASFAKNSLGTQWIEGLVAIKPGVLQVVAADVTSGASFNSNPVLVEDENDDPNDHPKTEDTDSQPYQLAWADPHGGQLMLHSKITDFFRYARDVAGVQFVGYQRNADAISEEDWKVQQREEEAYSQPGVFTPIPGYEWSGRTWQGGHHNIYFRRHNQPALRNEAADEMFQAKREKSDLTHILDVYRTYRNQDVTITPHVGGEHSDLTHHEPALEPAVEIVSSHGMFEWMLRDAVARNYRLGFLGGSDSYTGRPGDDRPGYQLRRYSKAGLTGIYVKDISLESFHEALRARRVYATTGARMILHCEADGHLMGSEYLASQPPTIFARVVGTAPLLSVELYRGLERIYTAPIEFEKTDRKSPGKRLRLLWQGSSRMTSYSGVVWEGAATLQGGRITRVDTLRFDSPRSRVLEQTDHLVRWQAWGCGYPMALLLDVDDADDAVLDIAVSTQTLTGPAYGEHGSRPPRRISLAPAEGASLRVRLNDVVENGSQQLNLGVLERRLEVGLAPSSLSSNLEFSYTDPAPQPGVHPYWIRVVQQDLETGWTSPVFVDGLSPEV